MKPPFSFSQLSILLSVSVVLVTVGIILLFGWPKNYVDLGEFATAIAAFGGLITALIVSFSWLDQKKLQLEALHHEISLSALKIQKITYDLQRDWFNDEVLNLSLPVSCRNKKSRVEQTRKKMKQARMKFNASAKNYNKNYQLNIDMVNFDGEVDDPVATNHDNRQLKT